VATSAPHAGLTRARLEIEGAGAPIPCWFNPKEYAISKQNSWNTPAVTGASLPRAQFTGGQPRKLQLDLLFDHGDSGQRVRDVTDALFLAMEVNRQLASGQGKNSGRPPMITFSWGTVVSFQAVADSLNVQYTLFDPTGEPLRAQVRLSLTQVAEARDPSSHNTSTPGQNPTTRAIAGLGTHVVRDGDTLAGIAYERYGDATRWRLIAVANGIDDPLRLRRGRSLVVPEPGEAP
jgi:nucleoid-associated protein YgaU